MNLETTNKSDLIAALCLLGDGEKGRELFAFAHPAEEKVLGEAAVRLVRSGGTSQREILGVVRKLRQSRVASVLDELHPGWILEKLGDESPRIFGLLCRYLPGDKVRSLLGHLSEEERKRLPKVSESYRIDPELAEIVRNLIEKKWSFSREFHSRKSFSFSDIIRMKMEDLRVLFWDLGLEEIRKAFFDVDSKILRAFLVRFTPREAAEIRGRIEGEGSVSDGEKKEAQKNLVALPLEPLSSGSVLREIGYAVFARSLGQEEMECGELVCQKLSLEEGHRLKRLIHEFQGKRPRHADQEEILRRVEALAEKGLIQRYWKETEELTKETAA